MAGGVFTGVVDEATPKEGLFCAGVAAPKRFDGAVLLVWPNSDEVPDGTLDAGTPNEPVGVVVVP